LINIVAFVLIGLFSIQILYLVVVFSRFVIEKPSNSSPSMHGRGVSVVVCAWNEFDHIFELLPILAQQQYEDFEIIIVDDRSNDGTNEYLKSELDRYPNCRLVTITETPEHVSSKKYALSLGIKMASKELILLTDADCRPTGPHWISSMAASMTSGKQIVLGFSPYWEEPGLLNGFIRFETLFTAWQYYAYALLGMPYMGVGRNLMYRRKLFFDKLGFRNHQRITGGDDDLFVNENATKANVALCFATESHTVSEPKHNFSDWYIQKKRHLSIGKFYKPKHKFWLGLYAFSHMASWLLAPMALLVKPPFLQAVLFLFGLRLLLFWVLAAIANHKLGRTSKWHMMPLFDIMLALYYLFMGWHSILKLKKNKWR
jgi:glycosyltransferase involved in cell wall biosynthesis